jgi:hypothetical protein
MPPQEITTDQEVDTSKVAESEKITANETSDDLKD